MTHADGPYYRPIESQRDRLPGWILVLAGLLVVGAALYLVTNLSAPTQEGTAGGGRPAPSGSAGASGAPAEVDVNAATTLVERGGCQDCHGPDLGGQASFPSLHGVAEGPVSDNLQDLGAAHPDDWAQLWIAGDHEDVADLDRRGMPAFADEYTPEEIELIVQYLKTL